MSSRLLLGCRSLVLACQSECVLDDDLRLFAGDDALDCGRVPRVVAARTSTAAQQRGT